MRLILDTNLWISFLISSRYDQLDKLLIADKYKLLFSGKLLSEFVDVAQRPKLQKYILSKDLDDLLGTIDSVAEFIDVSSNVDICRDPKDDFLLNLAIDGKADYLLTGDKDLLVLGSIEETKITTISDFFESVYPQ